MPDLAAINLMLRVTHRDQIPANLGYATQAWFLESLARVQPDLASTIHEGSRPKPFTTGGLIGANIRDGLLWLQRDQIVSLRLTTLHPDLTKITLNALVDSWLKDGVIIHDQRMIVDKAVIDETIDERTGVSDYEMLFQQNLLASAQTTRDELRHLRFNFLTPTSFKKTGGQQIPFPLPELVFGSLRQRWGEFSPFALPLDLPKFVEEHVTVVYHAIRTRTVSYERAERGRTVGFIGEVSYHIQSGDLVWLRMIHMLATFARFSGVGVRTTMGMGQVRAVMPALSGKPKGE